MADRRRAAIVTLLLLVAAALVGAPLDVSAMRLAGVGLLWGYAIVVAPLSAVLVVVAAVARWRG